MSNRLFISILVAVLFIGILHAMPHDSAAKDDKNPMQLSLSSDINNSSFLAKVLKIDQTNLPEEINYSPPIPLSSYWTNIMDLNWKTDDHLMLSSDAIHTKIAPASLRITPDVNSTQAQIYKLNISPAVYLTPWQDMWIYIHGDPSTINRIELYYGSASNFSKKDIYTGINYLGDEPNQYPCLFRGWNLLHYPGRRWRTDGNDSFANEMRSILIRVVYVKASKNNTEVSIDVPQVDGNYFPKCLLTFDDSNDTIYSSGYSYMKQYDLPGTFFINPFYVTGEGRVTKEHLTEMYNAGWAISNHGWDHKLPKNQSNADREVIKARDWLKINGFTRSADFFAYPDGDRYYYLESAIKTGVISARSSEVRIGWRTYNISEGNEKLLVPLSCQEIRSSTTFVDVKTCIDYSWQNHSNIVLVFHDIRNPATSSMQVSTSVFHQIVDYLYSLQLRGCIKCVSWDEFDHSLPNPR